MSSSLLVNLVPFVQVYCAEYEVEEEVDERCLFNKLANDCTDSKPFLKWKMLAGARERYFAGKPKVNERLRGLVQASDVVSVVKNIRIHARCRPTVVVPTIPPLYC